MVKPGEGPRKKPAAKKAAGSGAALNKELEFHASVNAAQRKKAVIIGLGAGLFALVGLVIVLLVSRKGAAIADAGAQPASSAAPQTLPVSDEPVTLEQKFNEVVARSKGQPVWKQLELWRSFQRQARGSWYEREARGRVRELEDRLAEVASHTFESLRKEAEDLAVKGKYSEAVARLKEFPRELDPDGTYAMHLQGEIEQIERKAREAEAFARASKLVEEGKYDEAAEVLQPLWERSVEAREKLDEIKVKRCLSRVKPLLEQLRSQAPDRLRRAREGVARELADRRARAAAIEQKMKGKSVVVKLRHGNWEQKGTVTAFGGETITFDFGTLPTDALHPRTLLDLWRQCTGPDDAQGHFEMGRCYVRLREFANADSAFKKAVQLDPKLEAMVPDLEEIRKKAASIAGEYSFAGNVITLEYGFRREEEVADFSATGCTARAGDGSLTITGQHAFYLYHEDIPFENGLSLSVQLDAGRGAAHLIAFEYVDANHDTVRLVLAADQAKSEVRVKRLTKPGAEAVREEVLLRPTHVKGLKTIEYEVRDGRATFSANGQKLLELALGKLSSPRAAIGGEAPGSSAGGTVVYRKLVLKGSVPLEWVRKLQSESEVILERELNKEHAILADERADLSGQEVQETTLDALIEGLPDGLAGRLMNARRRINTLIRWPNAGDFEQAREQLEAVRRAMDSFALVHYYEGRLYDAAGLRPQALKSIQRAIELEPAFPEPYVFRARMSIESRRYDSAAEDLAKVEQLMPDLPDLYAARAALKLREMRRKEALEDVLIARHLRPWDIELVKLEKKIRNVLRGPLWTRSYVRETDHYVVKSDISQERCDLYAENLEIALKHYEEMFEVRVPAKPKSEVLIFNTAEGYYTYADLTIESRMEHSVGYFEPVYRQFLFYETVDQGETLETLYHEQFHHYIDHVLPAIPVWLNEGLAEYFAGLVVDGKAKRAAGTPKVMARRLSMMHEVIRSWKKGVPFRDFMLLDAGTFYGDDRPVCYAQAWSMIYFFFNYEKGRYLPLLRRYIEELRKGRDNEEAIRFSFEQTDFEKIEREWLEYVRRLRP